MSMIACISIVLLILRATDRIICYHIPNKTNHCCLQCSKDHYIEYMSTFILSAAVVVLTSAAWIVWVIKA